MQQSNDFTKKRRKPLNMYIFMYYVLCIMCRDNVSMTFRYRIENVMITILLVQSVIK